MEKISVAGGVRIRDFSIQGQSGIFINRYINTSRYVGRINES